MIKMIFPILIPAVQVGPLSGRAAVTAHIVGVKSESHPRYPVPEIGIEPAMIAQPVKVDQNRPARRVDRKPGLVEQARAGGSGEPPLSVSHILEF